MSLLYFSPVTYAALAVFFTLCYGLYWLALPKPIPGIPYRKESAKHIMGDGPDFVNHFKQHSTVVDWIIEQSTVLDSPVYQLFFSPLAKPTVCVVDPREAYDVATRRAKEFDRSKFFSDAFSGSIPDHHITQRTNDKFRAGRRLLADTMTTPFLHTVAAPHIHKHSLYLMELWRVKKDIAAGHAFSVANDIAHMALDSIWEVTFGSELNTVSEETEFLQQGQKFDMPADKEDGITLPRPKYNRAVESLMVIAEGINKTIITPSPAVAHWFLRKFPSYRRARTYERQMIKDRLNDAKKKLLDRPEEATEFHGITSAIDYMVRREAQMAAKENRPPVYDGPQARDELIGFLVAGHETTATTVSWGVKMLADNPAVQKKLRDLLYGDVFPTFARDSVVPTVEAMTGAQVPYLDAVIEEIIRLAKTAFSTIRVTTRDVQVLGYNIPKGTDIHFITTGPSFTEPSRLTGTISESVRSQTSRDNKNKIPAWDPRDIHLFKPDRWLKMDEATGQQVFNMYAGPSQQFGGGLRGCFGKKLAYLEMKILFITMIWSFELLPVPKKIGGYEAFDNITHKPKNCYVLLKETGKNK